MSDTLATLTPQGVMKNMQEMGQQAMAQMGLAKAGKQPNPNITSQVIRNAEDWSDVLMLLGHEALRVEIKEMEKVLPYVSNGTDWKVLTFCKWFRVYFGPFVKSHLEAEEDFLFAKLQQSVQITEKIKNDHTAISKKVDEIIDVEEQYKLESDTHRQGKHVLVGKLVTMVNEVASMLKVNCMEEEQELTPLIRRFLSKQDGDQIITQTFSSEGCLGAGVDLPPIMSAAGKWADGSQYSAIEKRIPFIQKTLLNTFWMRDFESKNRGLLKQLSADSPPLSYYCGC